MQAKEGFAGFDKVSLVALAAFFSSLPIMLIPLHTFEASFYALTGQPLLEVVAGQASFLWALALSAMFTALTFLFICLLKTAFARIPPNLVLVGAVAYVVGLACVCGVTAAPFTSEALLPVAGVLVGFGTTILCLAWGISAQFFTLRTSLIFLIGMSAVMVVVNTLLLFLAPLAALVALMALALAGAAGCVRETFARSKACADMTAPGENWWDIFGRLDMSLLEGGKDFTSVLSRVLFFIVAPAILFLLFVTGMNIHHDAAIELPLELVASALAIVGSLPFLFVREEKGFINFAFRFYLPLIAFAAFILGNFSILGMQGVTVEVGVYVFSYVYGLLMCALVFSMAARMRSLELPAIGMLIVGLCLVAMVSYMHIEAGLLESFKFEALMVLFVVAVVLLFSMPSSNIFRAMLSGSLEVGSAQAGREESPRETVTLEDRVRSVSEGYGLTPRETEILHYLGRGHGAVYIAEQLVIAESTVRSHVKSIYKKMQVSSREELIHRIDEIGESQ